MPPGQAHPDGGPARAARAAVLGLLALLAACTATLEVTAHPQAAHLVPACLAVGAAATAVVAQRSASRLPGRTGRTWHVLALVPALLAVGQVIAWFGDTGRDLGRGGAADLPMVLSIPVAIAAAVFLLPPRARRRVGSRVLLDGAVVTVGVGVIGRVLLDDVLPGVPGGADGLVSAGYPAAGALLCGVGLITVTAVDDARRRAATWLLACFTAAAVVAISGALGGAVALLLHGQAWFVMLAAGVCAVAAAPERPPVPERDKRTLPLRGVVLAHTAAFAVLLGLTVVAAAGYPLSPVEGVGAATLLVLTAARTALWGVDGRRLTLRLRRTEGYFRALVDSGDAVTVVLDADGRIGWLSGAVRSQLGWAEPELSGRTLTGLLDPADRDLVDRVRTAVRDGSVADGLPATVRLRTREGGWRDVEVSGAARVGAPGAGSGDGLVLHLRDVSDRSVTQRELERLAYTDFLTGLPNRARFMNALAEVRAGSEPGCLLLVDLDGFKAVNDVAGHDAGDRLLCEVAGELRTAAREGDVVARLGGDEFAVLVRAGRAEATALAERLVAVLDHDHRPFAPDGESRGGPVFAVSGSVGVAELRPGCTPAEAVRRADLALRAAKAAGKNCVRSSGEALDRAVDRRARLAGDLPAAIAGGGLSLVFQPVVGVQEHRIVGLEALVRWHHPEFGDVPPDEFIGLAEDDGLVVPLQRWVLRVATTALAPLLAEGHDLRLGVNISIRHLQAGCLATDVARALAESGTAPHRLILEITESVLMGAGDGMENDLDTLRAMGCGVALDDFGKGYSSLARLARLPVRVLKMDRAFVAHIDDDPRAAALVASVVQLGRTLGMDVVAEGVETPGQLAALRRIGCGYLQGFLLGRPVPADRLPLLLAGFRPGVLDGVPSHF
ncbi:putative bifunctional diguanylate cyclase/phosphodiesterase [Geodermatophilus ruber]|uniref:PAS domain S-box-containing protein/diguanylate cyclase (GGDEF) domain-containing protein n=1 Tax=Geodermatophilus ruber TaxID=504800 RepID=A0A1I4I941_9ACTN|nr:GGDEF domain-containing phosphodiesterase [Geodermatophilus ruber]SFL50281.1 PAS domain S-box-containing protein/diguanylate cyclase (GGDEF) domain-containing protein [Geodermatophilus ruber]